MVSNPIITGAITDLRSAKAIIKILKQQDPKLKNITLDPELFGKIRKEFIAEGMTKPISRIPFISHIEIEGVIVSCYLKLMGS